MANTKKKTTPVAAKKDNTVEIPVVAAMTKAEPKKEAKVEAKKEAEVKKAVHAILMVKPTSKIELYKFKSELAIALPISGLDEDAAEEILESEGK